MGRTDLALRKRAIPFRAVPYIGPAYTNDVNIKIGTGLVDPGGAMRFSRPFGGPITSAKLSMNAVTAIDGGLILFLGKAKFAADGVNTVDPTRAEFMADWKKITGLNDGYYYGAQDNVYIDGLDITDLIPQPGDPDYNEDGFAIYFWNDAKGGTGGWTLCDFKIDCTVQLGAA